MLHSVGFSLLGALGYDGGAGLGLNSAPVYGEIASAVSGQTWVAVLILGGFVFWSYTWLPGQILNASRNLVAYAIDGVMPRQLAYVSAKGHTPVVAIWVVSLGSIVALYLFVFTNYYSTLTGIFGFILGFIVVSIAATLFPYRLPEVFESSPVRWRVGGIPVMTIVGAVSIVACVASAIIYLRDPFAGLQHADGSYYWTRILYNVAIFVSGLVEVAMPQPAFQRQFAEQVMSERAIAERVDLVLAALRKPAAAQRKKKR